MEQKEIFEAWEELTFQVESVGRIIQNPLDRPSITREQIIEWVVKVGKISNRLYELKMEVCGLFLREEGK